MTTSDKQERSQSTPSAERLRRRAIELFLEHLVWFILAIVLAAFSIFIKDFAQQGIFLNILEQSTFVGVLAVGLSIVIIAGQMDLSIESTMALAAMVTAYLVGTAGAGQGWLPEPAWLVVPATLGIVFILGAGVGLLNALLVIRLQINAFIATLATFIFLRGTVVAFSGGRAVYGLPKELRFIASEDIAGVPILAWITLSVFALCAFVLGKTPFGRYLYLLGGNVVAPFRAGIPVKKIGVWSFVLSGVLAAFTGWLLAARTSGATANLGVGMLFETFAAVVIGGVSLKGGTGRLSGVLAGVLLLSSIRTAINVLGMPPHFTQMIHGGLVLAAMLIDSLKVSIRAKYL